MKSNNNVVTFPGRDEIADPLIELLREGAREHSQKAVEAELSQYFEGFEGWRLNGGRAAVVRNGYHTEADIPTGVGPITVKVPKV